MRSNFNFERKNVDGVCTHLNDCATKRLATTPMLVFVHGMWGNAHIFDCWLRLADEMLIPACAIDLRGHGNSTCNNGGLGHASISDYVDDVNTVVNHFGSCNLVGHSMGALIARKVASGNKNVQKVVSVTSAPEAGMFLWGKILIKLMNPRYLKAMFGSKAFTISQQDAYELMGNELMLDDVENMFSLTGMESGRAALDITKWVHIDKLRIPSLVIGAGHDCITRVGIQRQIARRHGSDYVEYTGACHMIPLDSNIQNRVFGNITKFLQQN